MRSDVVVLAMTIGCGEPPITDAPTGADVDPPAAPSPPAPAPAPRGFDGRLNDGPASGSDDLDGDGTPEPWTLTSDSGSGYGSTTLTVGDRTVNATQSFGDFLAAYDGPPGTDAAFAEGTAALLYGAQSRRDLATVDGSFRWLWEYDALPSLPARPPLDTVRSFTPTWQDGPPSLPDSQYVVTSGEQADHVLQAQVQLKLAKSPSAVVVAYQAHNHHRLEEVGGCERWRVWTSDHGVVVAEPTRHAWVWVTTHVDKLRWPTVLDAACEGDLVRATIDHPPGGERRRVVIDPSAGRYGWMKIEEEGGEVALEELGKALR